MPFMTRSMASYNLMIKTLHHSKPTHRFQSFIFNPKPQFQVVPKHNNLISYGFGFLGNRSLQYLTTIHRPHSDQKTTRNFTAYASNQSVGPPLPPGSPKSSWENWVFGIFVTIVLPFFSSKWGPLLNWTKEVESTVETMEQIVDIVEDVAEKVEEVAEDISTNLPEDGNFKKVVDFIEDVAEEIAKDAQFAEDIIDKVQEVEDKLESLVDSNNEVDKEESGKKESEGRKENKN